MLRRMMIPTAESGKPEADGICHAVFTQGALRGLVLNAGLSRNKPFHTRINARSLSTCASKPEPRPTGILHNAVHARSSRPVLEARAGAQGMPSVVADLQYGVLISAPHAQ